MSGWFVSEKFWPCIILICSTLHHSDAVLFLCRWPGRLQQKSERGRGFVNVKSNIIIIIILIVIIIVLITDLQISPMYWAVVASYLTQSLQKWRAENFFLILSLIFSTIDCHHHHPHPHHHHLLPHLDQPSTWGWWSSQHWWRRPHQATWQTSDTCTIDTVDSLYCKWRRLTWASLCRFCPQWWLRNQKLPCCSPCRILEEKTFVFVEKINSKWRCWWSDT